MHPSCKGVSWSKRRRRGGKENDLGRAAVPNTTTSGSRPQPLLILGLALALGMAQQAQSFIMRPSFSSMPSSFASKTASGATAVTASPRPTIQTRRFANLKQKKEAEGESKKDEGFTVEDEAAMVAEFKHMMGGTGSKKPKTKAKNKKLPPRGPGPIELLPETPVEVWRGGQLAFGNYVGHGKKVSIKVRVEHGEIVTLDVGQVTGVWAENMLAGMQDQEDEINSFLVPSANAPPPTTPESWAALRLRAAKAMKSLTPHALSLEAFWSSAMLRWKRDKAPVDSHHLAAFLFQRPEYEAALKREQQQRMREAEKEAEAGASSGEGIGSGITKSISFLRLPRVTPAQRYAAAILLGSETFRFKRSVPTVETKEEGERGCVEEEVLMIVGQGFKPLEPSVVHSREVMSFVQAVRHTEEKRLLMATEGEEEVGDDGTAAAAAPAAGSAQWDASQWRMLHHLEVVALGAGVEGLSATSKQVLKSLGEAATPEGAKSVLLRAGCWTEKKGDGRGQRQADMAAAAAAARSAATPWPEEILELAKEAFNKTQKRRAALEKVATPNRPGRKGPHGRCDYRKAGLGAYALDPSGSEFADDALGFDPETGEILIHIADVQPLLESAPQLEALARHRGEALYLPDGPLHLLPPQALQAASLSDREVNECVTAAVTLGKDGRVVNVRFLLSLIPPVTRVRYDEANDLLASSPEQVPAYRRKAAADLAVLLEASTTRRGMTKRNFSDSKRVSRVKRNTNGELEAISFQRTPAHLMVDEFLALYSEAGRRFLKAHSVTLPLAPGSVSGGLDAARFGTGPLRRYTDVLVQHQVVAILKGQAPFSKNEVIQRMTQVNWQSKASQKLRSVSRNKVLLESFATYCASKAKAAGEAYAVVTATATGTGTEVILPDVGLRSYVRLPGDWKKGGKEGGEGGREGRPRRLFDLMAGKAFEVHVLRVDPAKGVIDLEFAHEKDAVGVTIPEVEEKDEGEEE